MEENKKNRDQSLITCSFLLLWLLSQLPTQSWLGWKNNTNQPPLWCRLGWTNGHWPVERVTCHWKSQHLVEPAASGQKVRRRRRRREKIKRVVYPCGGAPVVTKKSDLDRQLLLKIGQKDLLGKHADMLRNRRWAAPWNLLWTGVVAFWWPSRLLFPWPKRPPSPFFSQRTDWFLFLRQSSPSARAGHNCERTWKNSKEREREKRGGQKEKLSPGLRRPYKQLGSFQSTVAL